MEGKLITEVVPSGGVRRRIIGCIWNPYAKNVINVSFIEKECYQVRLVQLENRIDYAVFCINHKILHKMKM
jgi:hypothetical protein